MNQNKETKPAEEFQLKTGTETKQKKLVIEEINSTEIQEEENNLKPSYSMTESENEI